MTTEKVRTEVNTNTNLTLIDVELLEKNARQELKKTDDILETKIQNVKDVSNSLPVEKSVSLGNAIDALECMKMSYQSLIAKCGYLKWCLRQVQIDKEECESQIYNSKGIKWIIKPNDAVVIDDYTIDVYNLISLYNSDTNKDDELSDMLFEIRENTGIGFSDVITGDVVFDLVMTAFIDNLIDDAQRQLGH